MINLDWIKTIGYEKTKQVHVERYPYNFMMDKPNGKFRLGFYNGGACLWLKLFSSEDDAKDYAVIFINRFKKVMTEQADAYVGSN